MKTFSAASKTDLESLAAILRKGSIFTQVVIVKVALIDGIMRPPWWLGLLLMPLKAIKGRRGLENFVNHLGARNPEVITSMYAQTIEHMLTGKDTEDKNSVGGFSQRELNLVVNALGKVTQ